MLSYLVAGRADNLQGAAGDLSYQILLDSTVIATDATTTAQPFTARVIQFNAGAGSHMLTFAVSPGAPGDNTAFFDSIAIQVPEPTTTLLLLTFAPLSVDCAPNQTSQSIAIVLGLERSLDRHAKIIGLFLRKFGQLHADLV